MSRPRRTVLIAATFGAALAVSAGFTLNRAGPFASQEKSSKAPAEVLAVRDPGAGPTTAPSDAPQAPVTEPAPPLKRVHGPTADPSKSPGSPGSGDDDQSADPPAGGGSGTPTGSGASGAEGAVIQLTNKERAKKGCRALRADSRLATAARRHSADMAAKGYFDHNSQDGTTPWTRMERAGYNSPGAENIAKGQQTVAAVMADWMKSPGHRANILNCDLKAIGVGIARGGGGPYWTQDFGWS